MDEVFTYRLNMDYRHIIAIAMCDGTVAGTYKLSDLAAAMNYTEPHMVKAITDINIRANQQDMEMPFTWSADGLYVTMK
jgi:hypothetical protein